MIYRVINENVRQNLINEIKQKPLGYQVKIEDLKRSNPQNALYWACIQIIAKETGHNKDELHEAFKRQFIGVEQGKDLFGNLYLRPKSSAKLKKKEFSEYMTKVEVFANSLDIILPSPDYFGLENS